MLKPALENYPLRTRLIDQARSLIRLIQLDDEIPFREQLSLRNWSKDGTLLRRRMTDPGTGD